MLYAKDKSEEEGKQGKTERLEARLTREQKDLLQRAADLQGRSLSDFVIHSAWSEAVKTLESYEFIKLGVEDSKRLAEALLNPPPPNEALRRAAERCKQMLSER